MSVVSISGGEQEDDGSESYVTGCGSSNAAANEKAEAKMTIARANGVRSKGKYHHYNAEKHAKMATYVYKQHACTSNFSHVVCKSVKFNGHQNNQYLEYNGC